MGCSSGMKDNPKGCYGDCYAARSAKTYGFDFSNSILRGFIDRNHIVNIVNQINNIDMPFFRVGCSGDPSEDWGHTISVLKKLTGIRKDIVLITRHWDIMSNEEIKEISNIGCIINTSVSALDNTFDISKSLSEYNRYKRYGKSILRVVTCDFNEENPEGLMRFQKTLLKNENVIDTIFRPSKNSRYIKDGVINVYKENFNGKKQLSSKHSRKVFMGKCNKCAEMCGSSLKKENTIF
jgi:hypothetical protein